jgi:hypothetical protein
MGWRQVVVLWIVCAALGVWWVLGDRPPRSAEPVEPVRARFLPVAEGDVREMRLLRGGRSIVSRRAEGRWTVVEPAETSISPDLVSAFANALAAAEEIQVVAERGGEPGAYGFDEGAARVELVVEGRAPVVVTIGGPNPPGTAVYARRDDAPRVVLIGRNVRYYGDLLFQALPAPQVPADEQRRMPVGG